MALSYRSHNPWSRCAFNGASGQLRTLGRKLRTAGTETRSGTGYDYPGNFDVGRLARERKVFAVAVSPSMTGRPIDAEGGPIAWFAPDGACASMADILEHGRLKFPHAGLLHDSSARCWSGIGAEIRAHPAGELDAPLPRQTEVTLALSGDGAGLVRRRGNGQRQETAVVPGTVWLCPAGVAEDAISISRPIERVAHIYLSPLLFHRFSAEARGSSFNPGQIGYIAGLADPLIEQIMHAVVGELEAETAGGALLVEALATSMVARLALSHADGSARLALGGDGALDDRRLRRVLDLIEDEIEGDLSIERLTDVACLSRFHFSRAFKRAMGIAPHAYVAERRFNHAAHLLTQTDRSLADIAIACSFSSQANFSRAFAQVAGISPARYRAERARSTH